MSAAVCTDDAPCHLFYMSINGRNATGVLPDILSVFTELEFLDVGENSLKGPAPSMVDMPLLIANFSYNSLTGPLPTIQNTSELYLLYFSNNLLNGTIPESYLTNIPKLQYFNIYNNSIGGTISENITKLNCLTFISAAHNQLEGSLPRGLFQMRNLTEIYVSDNKLTGTLPEDLGTILVALRVSENSLWGTIPRSICNNPRLQSLTLHTNSLTGTLPDCISQLSELTVLQVQRNRFAGSPSMAFNGSRQQRLMIVDISNNGFTGSVPSELFLLPDLRNLAAGNNCFEGSLPSTICETGNMLQVMALDGLSASLECVVELWDPLSVSNAFFGGLLNGPLPDCVWSLPNITTVHFAGNGLTGSLPSFDDCDSYPNQPCGLSKTLSDVVLSHNRLKGTIPEVFQQFPFAALDLSYNKLKGRIEDMTNMSFAYSSADDGASLSLEVNRLTGRIPPSYTEAYNVDILRGNLFACGSDHHDVVKHDPASRTAVCGSEQLVGALSSFVVYIVLVLIGVVAVYVFQAVAKRSLHRVVKSFRCVLHTLQYCREVAQYTIPSQSEMETLQSMENHDPELRKRQFYNVYQLLSALTLIRRIGWVVLCYSLLVCVPTYVAFYRWKGDPYSTHTDRYSWISSATFLTGQLPAVVLFLLWSFQIVLVLWMVITHYNLHKIDEDGALANMVHAFESARTKLKETILGSSHAHSLLAPIIRESRYSNLRQEDEGSAESPVPLTETARNAEAVAGPHFHERATEAGGHELNINQRDRPSRISLLSRLFGRRNQRSDSTGDMSQSVKTFSIDNMSELIAQEARRSWWSETCIFLAIVFIDVSVIMATNVGYLLAQNNDEIGAGNKIALQVGMAVFKIIWNVFALRVLVAQLPFRKTSVKLHVGLLVFNSIFGPCLATTFSDADCFRDVFVAAPEISVSYDWRTCVESYQVVDYETEKVITVCTHYNTNVITTRFIPSFIYYYTCAAELLTVYVPVFIFLYTILITLLPVMYTILAALRTEHVPLAVLQQLDGALRPHDRGKVMFAKLVRARPMQAIMVHHLIVLLCFGVACPPLAVVISCALTVDTIMWQVILTRYIKYESPGTPFHPDFTEDRQQSLAARISDLSSQSLALVRGAWYGANAVYPPPPPSPASSPTTQHRQTNDVTFNMIYPAYLPEDTSDGGFIDREHCDALVKEEARLYELHTVCGEAWQTVRASMWQMMYIPLFFYCLILYNMVGDEVSWTGSFWVPAVLLSFVAIVRVTLVDIIKWVYEYCFVGYVYKKMGRA